MNPDALDRADNLAVLIDAGYEPCTLSVFEDATIAAMTADVVAHEQACDY
jgi:hypothetical protein